MLAANVGAGRNRGCWLQAWVLAASVLCWRQACHGGCERGCWLQPWVLAASVSASWKRRCWLQAWVLPASVGAACKRGCCLQTWMLPASVGWLHAWVLAANTLCWNREKLLELHSFENTRPCTWLGCAWIRILLCRVIQPLKLKILEFGSGQPYFESLVGNV